MTRFAYTLIVTLFFSSSGFAETYLYFNSQPGDYIGQGVTQTWTTQDGTFTATGSAGSNVVSIRFNGSDWWTLNFAAPSGQPLQVGSL